MQAQYDEPEGVGVDCSHILVVDSANHFNKIMAMMKNDTHCAVNCKSKESDPLQLSFHLGWILISNREVLVMK